MSSSPSRSVRRPAVAGMFYPAEADLCTRAAAQFVLAQPSQGQPVGQSTDAATTVGQTRLLGAIVPHAGWICSGAIAGAAIAALRNSPGNSGVDVVVVFGAVHTPLPLNLAALASHDAWSVPTGTSQVPLELSGKLRTDTPQSFGVDDRFHEREHAVEVELPLIQQAWPNARVLPIEIPLMEESVQIGIRAAGAVRAEGLRAVYLASSDLTHYGPAYRFTPVGVGPPALEWAKENDRRLLSVVTEMRPERVVPEVQQRLNACGGGAIAAMLAACREHGAKHATVLRHANSYEVLREVAPQRPDNAVGYAAVVVG